MSLKFPKPEKNKRTHGKIDYSDLAFPKPGTKKVSKRKTREGNCKTHLSNLHELPCIVSGKYGVDVHHLKSAGNRGAGMKSEDRWGVPLRHDLHMELENKGSKNEVSWFKKNGVADVVALAEKLWENRESVSAMKKIILTQKGKTK